MKLFSTHHTDVGARYFALGALGLSFGAALSMILRWSLGFSPHAVPLIGRALFPEAAGAVPMASYGALFTLHGTVMVFFAFTPLLAGFAHALLPRWVGARDMAFARLGALSWWITLAGLAAVVSGLFVPLGAASAGWSSYPPLSETVGTPGLGQSLFSVSLLLSGVASLCVAINVLATIARSKIAQIPLSAWGFGLSSALTVLFVPVLCAAQILLLADRHLGARFFSAGLWQTGATGDPVLYQHLFWIFGHPEVYVLALPVWAMLSDLLADRTNRPAPGRFIAVMSLSSIAGLGALVYGHHMFSTGFRPVVAGAFMTLTVLVSVPSSTLAVTWLATLWRASLRLDAAALFALGAIELFVLGGLTGIPLGSVSTDLYLHGTSFVPGHFHLVMAASLSLGMCAALHHHFPTLFARRLSERLGLAHFALSLPLMHLVFLGMLLLGLAGAPRRVSDLSAYGFLAHTHGLTRAVSLAAFALGLAQLLLVANVLLTLSRPPTEPP